MDKNAVWACTHASRDVFCHADMGLVIQVGVLTDSIVSLFGNILCAVHGLLSKVLCAAHGLLGSFGGGVRNLLDGVLGATHGLLGDVLKRNIVILQF